MNICNDKTMFRSIDKGTSLSWESASGDKVESEGMGVIEYWVSDTTTGEQVCLLLNAQYCPKSPWTLISVRKLEDVGLFADFGSRVLADVDGGTQVEITCKDGTYSLMECGPGPADSKCLSSGNGDGASGAVLAATLDNTDRMLDPDIVAELAMELLGKEKFDVDMYATQENAQCDIYYTEDNSHKQSLVDKDFWSNPPYVESVIEAMLQRMVDCHKRRPATTSFTVCLPQWDTASWWVTHNPNLAKFEVVRTFPPGSLLFTAPAKVAGGKRVPLGPTRWPVVIFHLAADMTSVVHVSRDVLMHVRLGHCGSHVLPALVDAGVDLGLGSGDNTRRKASIVSHSCEPCRVAKATRPEAPSTGKERSKEPMYKLYMDFSGPYTKVVDNSVYALMAVDDCSDWALVRTLSSRNAKLAVRALDSMRDEAIRILQAAGKADGGVESKVFRVIQTDNALEFTGKEMSAWCKENNTLLRHTSMYLHQNNAKVERVWRTIGNGMRALLLSADMPKYMWPHAMNHYTLLRNCLPQTGRLEGKSPFEVVFDRLPDLSRLKAWGCIAYMYLDYDQRAEEPVTGGATYLMSLEEGESADIHDSIKRRKLADRARQLIYIGQDETSNGY